MITSLSTVENCSGPRLDAAEESPLEVLSRAATMVRQESQQSDDKPVHKQTTKWKRDRRRLPEYSRKSDPKVPETLGVEPSSPEASISNGGSPLSQFGGIQIRKDLNSPSVVDSPLDMTVRQRGEPPSYDQTISNPGYRSSFRTTVIHNGAPPMVSNRDHLPSGISMCDTVIEEHFRRSLGQDYHTIFQSSSHAKEKEESSKPQETANTKVVEFLDETGLSVDDHFAKALGDTWKQLNQKEQLKTRDNENSLVSAKN
ncbi:transcription cofactor vestigial-like protein 4 isoform X1 [Euwallacea similis]|uniref:transcription cofactor vestigial-like protein 4 isoform X1 n=1 Tax=Euwallacea similis TaxID=1736056 RepID=UPI0034502A2A